MNESGPFLAEEPQLERHFGLLASVALNITMLVGSGVFLTIPLMIGKLPGPYALVGWLAAGILMLVDGLIWSELGASLPASGGSYRYLLESYGRNSWGRMMAFLFIWQFLISGPLEIAAGFVSIAQVSNSLDPDYAAFNKKWTERLVLGEWQGKEIAVSFGPSQAACVLLGVVILGLLYRRITGLGKLTVTFWLGVLGAMGWILIAGWSRFDPSLAFDFPRADEGSVQWGPGLGATMVFAMYSYLGYYHVCYIGDEVRDPARTIPRSILLTAVLVCVLFIGLHLAMVGTVSWREIPADMQNLPAEFMTRVHGAWAAKLITLCVIWSSFGSIFASLLGYSRIPYGAARYGHFFAVFARVHPVRRLPHVSLLLVGGLTFFWSFFDLGDVIDALVTTRILGLFLAQIIGVMLLRRRWNGRLPFQMWLYPLPCALALAGWGYMYVTSRLPFIVFSLAVLALGTLAFLAWAKWTGGWPFGVRSSTLEVPSVSALADRPGMSGAWQPAAVDGPGSGR
jgi:amino acid transporter